MLWTESRNLDSIEIDISESLSKKLTGSLLIHSTKSVKAHDAKKDLLTANSGFHVILLENMTMVPERCFRMWGRTAVVTSSNPNTFVRN